MVSLRDMRDEGGRWVEIRWRSSGGRERMVRGGSRGGVGVGGGGRGGGGGGEVVEGRKEIR